MQTTQNSWIKKGALAGGLIAIIAAGTWYLAPSEGVYDYDPAKDRAFIVQLMKDNWEWLITSPDYSPEYMLDTKSSSKLAKHLGNLTIKVYRVHGKPVGFTTYHKKNLFEGRVLFLAVDEKYRGKGYARKLLQYALDDLKSRGFSIIRINTRVANKPARKLYESFGFTKFKEDDYFILYERNA